MGDWNARVGVEKEGKVAVEWLGRKELQRRSFYRNLHKAPCAIHSLRNLNKEFAYGKTRR